MAAVTSQLRRDIEERIRDYPDFPQAGVLFRDITPLLADSPLLDRVVEALAEETRRVEAEKVAGIESRGFLFGIPVALRLGLPFVPVRKQGKLPGETVYVEYQLEYGTAHLEMQADSVTAEERVILIDDLLATGGTAVAAGQLIATLGGQVAAIATVIELKALQGRRALDGYKVFSLLSL